MPQERTTEALPEPLAPLLTEIAACRACAGLLPMEPRPVVQAGLGARVLIIGQAPGTKVHASGIPWDDDSGTRLRGWLGIDDATFRDPDRIAVMPMGFCYPGKASGGDKPPRPECRPLWHDRLRAALPNLRLTLLVGQYAQAAYLPQLGKTLTERVRRFAEAPEGMFPLPHPAWRARLFMAQQPWFEAELLPVLRARVAAALSGSVPLLPR